MKNIEANMIVDDIRAELFRLQDTAYRDFQAKLIPSEKPLQMILWECAGKSCRAGTDPAVQLSR